MRLGKKTQKEEGAFASQDSIKTYNEATIIKIVWYWRKPGSMKENSWETDLNTYRNFNKSGTSIQ